VELYGAAKGRSDQFERLVEVADQGCIVMNALLGKLDVRIAPAWPSESASVMTPRALLFDAYGTLFDVHAVVLQGSFSISADVEALATLWRQRQLEYTWLLSLMGHYEDFWSVTKAALHSSSQQLQIELEAAQREGLLQAYLSPPVFPEVKPALASLEGFQLAILSNGSPKMLAAAVRHSGLDSLFGEIISVDRAQVYKPSPRAYALGTDTLGLRAKDILFVSSNWWDAWGAKAFGYNVCWCNRFNARMEFSGDAPDLVVTGLGQIADILAG
jgi:2-haloacid dehalogenase